MDLSNLVAKWSNFVNNLNKKGIPLPLARDPKTGRGDVALTLVFLSSLWVQVALIGKFSKLLDGVDDATALNWFFGCCALYWARKMSSDGKKITLEENSEPAANDQDPAQK